MLLQIPDVLTPEQVAQARQLLMTAHWVDGRVTAGHQSSRTKDNLQLPEDHPVAKQIGEMILASLQRNPLFISAALPFKVFPPLFNCYEGGVSSSSFPRFERNLNTGGRNYDEINGVIAHTALHHSAEHPSSVTITVVKK